MSKTGESNPPSEQDIYILRKKVIYPQNLKYFCPAFPPRRGFITINVGGEEYKMFPIAPGIRAAVGAVVRLSRVWPPLGRLVRFREKYWGYKDSHVVYVSWSTAPPVQFIHVKCMLGVGKFGCSRETFELVYPRSDTDGWIPTCLQQYIGPDLVMIDENCYTNYIKLL